MAEEIKMQEIASEPKTFQYGEYSVITTFSDSGLTLTEALVDYVEKMASLKFSQEAV